MIRADRGSLDGGDGSVTWPTPVRGAVGDTYKIHLPADKAGMSSPCGLGVDLTGEVDLERAIDRDEAAETAKPSASWVYDVAPIWIAGLRLAKR